MSEHCAMVLATVNALLRTEQPQKVIEARVAMKPTEDDPADTDFAIGTHDQQLNES